MDSKGFFLGLIAAVVLFLLWKKETAQAGLPAFLQPPAPAASTGGGCSSCAGPSAAAAPAAQSAAAMVLGTEGQISPGTPPLQTVAGTGSFYGANGPTPDNTFTNFPSPARQINTSQLPAVNVPNVPGSPTTPANQVPVRATQTVAPTSQLSFQQRWGVSGIPRTAGARSYIQ